MKDNRDPLERTLERLQLCQEVVQEVHFELEPPTSPDAKADILLAVEALTRDVLDLMKTTQVYVWGEPEEKE